MPREGNFLERGGGGEVGRGITISANVQLPKIVTLWMALHLAKHVPKWRDGIFKGLLL
jgi:hypothetical protein